MLNSINEPYRRGLGKARQQAVLWFQSLGGIMFRLVLEQIGVLVELRGLDGPAAFLQQRPIESFSWGTFRSLTEARWLSCQVSLWTPLPPSPSSVLDSARGAEVWEINVYKLGMDANGNVGLGLLPMKSVLILDLRLWTILNKICSQLSKFLGLVLQSEREKIVHLFDMDKLICKEKPTEPTWKSCGASKGPVENLASSTLTWTVDTTSFAFATVLYQERFGVVEVDSGFTKKTFGGTQKPWKVTNEWYLV